VLKQEKERLVGELVERLRSTDTLILADYRGLDMTAIEAVRSELLKHGARFSVVKNTLARRAAGEAGIEPLGEFLTGPTAIAFVGDGDMVAVAKTLSETARTTRILEVKGAILQGQPITAEQVRDLASLPPADVLRGQVVGAIVGPLNAIVGIFAAPLRDLVGVVDARIDQLRERGDTSEATEVADVQPGEPADRGIDAVAEPAATEADEGEDETPEATAGGGETMEASEDETQEG
jgi:large subunit ribosomal protein L10